MKWDQFVRDYLTFTRREKIGLLVIVFIIISIFLFPRIIANQSEISQIPTDTTWISAVKKLELKEPEKNNRSFNNQSDDNDNVYQFDRSVNNPSSTGNLFYFDPNTIDQAGWQKLGLKDKTIHIIQNYLNKGGHFFKPEDLKKIYGLRHSDYLRFEPYIKIENSLSEDKPDKYAEKENEPKHFTYRAIDINTSDTTAFISLPGIGSKLAARIVNFRAKLGGFYSISQVRETFGLPDSAFQKIEHYLKLENTSVKKLNINIATVDELKAHPYIKYSIANPIVAFRKEHGPFSKVEDIKKLMAVTDEIFDKISPYLSTQ